jgi:DNA-binding LacI/PurR family transcriptional regulator
MSLKKISEMTGVSVSTVSRVLNNVPGSGASREIRERIWQAAQDTGYTPNRSAQRLRRGDGEAKTRRVAIVAARLHSLEADPFFYELYMNVQSELFRAGCVAVRVDARDDARPEIPECDGMVILGRCSHSLLEALKRACPNLVGIWRNPTDFDIDEVMCDGKKAAGMAVEYLLKLGHRNIAYIGDCSYESRYVGYCDALIRNSIPIDYPLIVPTGQTEAEGYGAMQKIAASGTATAVFCANDITAVGALRALAEMGRRRPKIAVVSIDNIDLAQQTRPLLTTINIPREDMAHMAVNVLLDRIGRGHREHVRVEFPCRLVRRLSCGEGEYSQ